MKRTLLSVFVAIVAAITSQLAQAQSYPSLPQSAKEYIEKHFKGYMINHYEKDTDILDVEYQIYVTNNENTYKLNFDKKGVVEKIESKNDRVALPASVIPSKVSQYVRANYPKTKIIEWKRKRNTQVVELSNDLELEFNHRGDFLRIDD
jgi:hypothetical protein